MTYDDIMDRPTFIDIDGTITVHPTKQFSEPVEGRIQQIKDLVASGTQVVVWSGGGTAYAKAFCNLRGILGIVTAIGKPEVIVDDNPDIRPKGRMNVTKPEDFFK